MLRRILTLFSITIAAMPAACSLGGPPVPNPKSPPAATATATPSPTPPATCADIDAFWGRDWPAVLDTLAALIETGQGCGEEPLLSKKYAVHFNYAASLEEQGQLEPAIDQYRAALAIDPRRGEALGALVRLAALPRPTPPACLSDSPPRPDPAPANLPDTAHFVKMTSGQLQLDGEPFTIKGVNYYPHQAPWERFFEEADPAAMAEEFDLIQAAGFNTLRIFLWYQPLFTCRPEAAIPNESTFTLVDTLFRLAGERGLKLIVNLNDLPDLLYRPLYTDWGHYDTQTAYIVRRYRNEPALLAWDVRNGPDEDISGSLAETDIINWLAHITRLIRRNDPDHLITAGWSGDPRPAEPYIDILAFQHWAEPGQLEKRLAAYRTDTTKPLLLIAAGEHSWPASPESPQDEASQAAYLQAIAKLAETNGAGWVLWTAFDFSPAPGQPDNPNFHFGLWRADLSPKPVLAKLPLDP